MRFARLLIGVLTAAVVVELAIAFAPPGGIYVYDAEMGFRVRPGATWGVWHANRFGFNDRDHTTVKPPGVLRVVILGDSFNWAGGPDGNYTALLQQRFDAAPPGDSVEIVNAGYPGTHPGEQLIALRRYGLPLAPDVVMLGVFVGNDLLEAQPWRRVIPVGGELTPIDLRRTAILTLWSTPFLLRSHAWRFLTGRWAIARLRLAAWWRGADLATTGATVPDDVFYDIERDRMRVAAVPPDADVATGEAEVLAAIDAMQTLTQAAGAELVVAAYPDAFQVDEPLRTAVLRHAAHDADRFAWERPQQVLAEHCRERDVPYVDLLPAFREAEARGSALYLRNEPHWSAEGQALAATLLEPMLRSVLAKRRSHAAADLAPAAR